MTVLMVLLVDYALAMIGILNIPFPPVPRFPNLSQGLSPTRHPDAR